MRNRQTLVVSNTARTRISWSGTEVILLDSVSRLRQGIATHDVARVILDRCASADEFLHLLTTLPNETAGDVLSVRDDGTAFLSSTGRGGDRVLYALSASDVGFYLETHGVTATRTALALIA